MKKVIIIGTGGNSKVIIGALQSRIESDDELEITGLLNDDTRIIAVKGYPVLGPIKIIEYYRQESDVCFLIGIGYNDVRKRIYQQYPDVPYYTLIHPSALIGTGVTIGAGSVVMPGAIINTDTHIGKQVLINTGAIIEHDNAIGDFAHVAPGATTAGNVTIGEASMLGIGAKVIQGITIGRNVMIGAGAVVVSDIPADCTAIGVPAKVR